MINKAKNITNNVYLTMNSIQLEPTTVSLVTLHPVFRKYVVMALKTVLLEAFFNQDQQL